MNIPIVSVVIPVYNQSKYLARTIHSVLKQDYPHIECIVVDDGSTDDSFAVAQMYGEQVVLLRQVNSGQAVALNNGFGCARGRYIGYLSSDDTIDPTLVSQVVSYIAKQDDDRVVVFPQYRTINLQDEVINNQCPAFVGMRHMIENFRCDVGPGAFFSRNVLGFTNGWNASYRQIPDYEFWLRVARNARFHQLPSVLASFRVHQGSQTFAKSTYEKAEESIRLVQDEIHREGFPESLDFDIFRASAYVYSACMHLRSGRFRVGVSRYVQALDYSMITAIRLASIKRMLISIFAAFQLRRT